MVLGFGAKVLVVAFVEIDFDLLNFKIGFCNLTPTSIRIITCFKRLNDWYGPELGLQKF